MSSYAHRHISGNVQLPTPAKIRVSAGDVNTLDIEGFLAMQAQLRPDRNAVSRPAFSRMAHDERCQLYFPQHDDQVHCLC